jgi:ArsR family metal-binding transcriptional regulator
MFGREKVDFLASPYLMPNVYNRLFLDTQYNIRKDSYIFKIGDLAVLVDQDGDITIKEKELRGSECLWELLTRKRVNKDQVT